MILNKEQELLDKFRSLIDIKLKEIKNQKSENKDHSLDLGKLIILVDFEELILDHQLEIMKR